MASHGRFDRINVKPHRNVTSFSYGGRETRVDIESSNFSYSSGFAGSPLLKPSVET